MKKFKMRKYDRDIHKNHNTSFGSTLLATQMRDKLILHIHKSKKHDEKG